MPPRPALALPRWQPLGNTLREKLTSLVSNAAKINELRKKGANWTTHKFILSSLLDTVHLKDAFVFHHARHGGKDVNVLDGTGASQFLELTKAERKSAVAAAGIPEDARKVAFFALLVSVCDTEVWMLTSVDNCPVTGFAKMVERFERTGAMSLRQHHKTIDNADISMLAADGAAGLALSGCYRRRQGPGRRAEQQGGQQRTKCSLAGLAVECFDTALRHVSSGHYFGLKGTSSP